MRNDLELSPRVTVWHGLSLFQGVPNARRGCPQEGKPHATKGEEVGKQVFCGRPLWTIPYEGVILLSSCEKKNDVYSL